MIEMNNRELVLKIKDVTMTYPNGVKALDNISLEIPAGMYGLLGPNGAGKSSLMRILATLQAPNAGEINLGGINCLGQKEDLRKTLGYLPQDFGLLPKVKAEDLLNHFAIIKGINQKQTRRTIVESLLKQTNLWDVRRQKVGGFSGGMKQRFGVAVALLGNPKLLIVDEPTAGLDPAERVRFLNLLSELGENSIVILSTHLVEDVSELCTNMAIIRKGQILLEDRPLEAINNIKSKVWRKLISKDSLPTYEKDFDVISTKLLSGKTMIHAFAASHPGNGFEAVEPDLEDVYFCTMKGILSHSSKREL